MDGREVSCPQVGLPLPELGPLFSSPFLMWESALGTWLNVMSFPVCALRLAS